MIKAMAQSAKLLGLVMLFAFVSQAILIQAEHVGVIECVNGADKTDSGHQDQTKSGDGCCTHAVAIALQETTLAWGFRVAVSFNVFDDVMPDGPYASIDQPPRVA